MINKVDGMINSGKKSLQILLRKKAYDEVIELLKEQNIDVKDIDDSDLEELIEARVNDKENQIKGIAIGSTFALIFSSIIGF